MDQTQAIAIVDHVRRFADALLAEWPTLEASLEPSERDVWRARFGRALGALQDNLLNPVEQLHPAAVPNSMGGTGLARPLK